MFFLGVFDFGSLLCGVAVSSDMLIVGRAIAGIGGSDLLNGGLTIIRAYVPNEKSASMKATPSSLFGGNSLTFCDSNVYLGILMGSEFSILTPQN
jgi:MFS family permease